MSFSTINKWIILLSCLTSYGFGQINIAISDFNNKSDALFLDSWQRNIPALLKSHLSANKQILILDRALLDKILDEQALKLSGLMDSSEVQNIGKLVGADFVISGTIDKQNDELMIAVDLIRVKTGQIQSEIVRSENKENKNAMVEMLGNNLIYRLTGDGQYQNEKIFKSNSIWYWTGSTLLLGTATLFTNIYYHDSQDKYNSATELKDFDRYYDQTNNSRNLYVGLAAATGTALLGTIIDLMIGDEANTIKGGIANKPGAFKGGTLYVSGKKEITIGLQINF